MTRRDVHLTLASPDDTCALARCLAEDLRPGDVLLLSGGIGAGKTHFARCMIQALQDTPEDVPSPTFTLVQEYQTRRGALWHADLYRLSGPDDVIELGLIDAFDTAICIVEWPDRLGDLAPANALVIRFSDTLEPEVRDFAASAADPRWHKALTRIAA